MKTKSLLIVLSILFTGLNSYSQSDLCASATVIDPNTGCVSGSNATATSSLTTNGCTPNPVNEVWYTYTVEGTQDNFTLTTGTLEDAVMTLYAGGCASGSYDYCTNATGTGDISATYAFAVGTQVLISIASTTITDGDFDLCVTSTTTTNDEPGSSSCEPLSICTETSFSFNDMSIYSTSGTKASCFKGPGANATQDVWISFCVSVTGAIEWDASPQSSTTEFDWSMWDVTDGCPGVEVACNYDWNQQSGADFGMEVGNATAGDDYEPAFNGIAGHCYAIQIVNWSIDGTGVDFNGVDENPGGAAQISPGVNFSVSQTAPCSPPVTATFGTGAGHDGTVNWDFGNGNTSLESGTPSTQVYTDPGTYAVTSWAGTGACYEQQTEYVTVYGPLAVTNSIVDDFCNDTNGGEISLTPTGGDGIFTYNWTPNVSSGPTATGLAPGNYSIEVVNALCGESITVPITLTGVVCCGVDVTFGPQRLCMSDAPITLSPTITGATTYTVNWTPATGLNDPTLPTPVFTPPTPGFYTMQIEVDNTAEPGGCVTPRTVIYNVVDVIPAGSATATSCPGTSDGEVSITGISGGLAPYVTTWDNGLPAGATQTGLLAGTYTATITEDGGCTGTIPLTVVDAIPFTLGAGAHDCNTTPLNSGDCFTLPGAASITSSYTCSNSPFSSSGSADLLNATKVKGVTTLYPGSLTATVSGTSAGDLLESVCFTITHLKQADINNVYVTAPDGSTIFYLTDATFALNGANGTTTYCLEQVKIDAYSGSLDGNWTINGTDISGSGGSAAEGTIDNIVVNICTPVYPNLWSPTTNMTGDPTNFTPQVCPTVTTTYTLTLTDENGCTITDDIEVIVGTCTILGNHDFTFNASHSKGVVNIEWQVIDDSAISRYEINKSSDGKMYSKLNNFQSKRTENVNNYRTVDTNPNEGVNYYQIAAYDDLGELIFSDIRTVFTSETNGMSLLPNPAKDNVVLVFDSQMKSDTELKIYDVAGKLVFESNFSSAKGTNNQSLNVSELTPGVYKVLLSSEEGVKSTELIKV